MPIVKECAPADSKPTQEETDKSQKKEGQVGSQQPVLPKVVPKKSTLVAKGQGPLVKAKSEKTQGV